nr:MAG TPA: hypothetical protein [Caudoviricetes sp.]
MLWFLLYLNFHNHWKYYILLLFITNNKKYYLFL